MRFVGSFIVWVLPDRILEDVASSGAQIEDYVSTIVGTAATFAVGIQIVESSQGLPETGLLKSFAAGIIGVGIVNVLLVLGITWAFAVALRDHEVDGRPLGVGFSDLLASHLQIHPVGLTIAFLAVVSGSTILWVLLVVACARTLDLQARALRHITGIVPREAYKAAAVLFAILLGTIGALSFVL